MSGTIESQLRYHAKHPDTPPPLRGLMLRAVEELRYRAMVIEQRNAEIKRGHDDFVQAITDPENQPSQWGTVTLAMYEKLELDTAAPAPQAQQGEPVAQARLGMKDGLAMALSVVELYGMKGDVIYREIAKLRDGIAAAPAPQAQPVAQPLTDEAIYSIVFREFKCFPLPYDIRLTRAIEAAHGINGMVEAATRPAIDAAIKQGGQHE